MDLLQATKHHQFDRRQVETTASLAFVCSNSSWTSFSWRLDKAEEALKRTYGENMERLKLLKGGAGGAEMVYFVRLHLLQGVAAFHKGGTNKRHDSSTQCST